MDEKIIQNNSLKQIIDRLYPDMLTPTALTQILLTMKKHRKVSLKEIADLILFIADTSHRNWNIEMILTCINETFDSINWRDVYEKFLESDLKIWNTEYLYTLVDCWIYISGIITVPYEIFFRKWMNRENQIDFFKILLESDEKKTQVYSNIFFEKVITKDDIKNTKYKRNIEYESNFNSIELFKSLEEINGTEIVEIIRDKSPEYCILGLAAAHPFCEELFNDLLVQFSEGITSQFVYYMLFKKHRSFIFNSFKKVSDRISLTRMLDIFLEHKMLPIITEIIDPEDLCFDIVILSSRRDHLNLEIWLANNLKSHAYSFMRYLLDKLFLCASFLGKSEQNQMKIPCINSVDKSEKITCEKDSFIPKQDNEIFPFNRTIVSNVFKIIDSNMGVLDEPSLEIYGCIKQKFTDSKPAENPCFSDKAASFITEVINSHNEVESSIVKLKDFMNGDESCQLFVRRIFGLLIDNYSGLCKLPNSDMVALFFGELIKRRIFSKPFLKVAMQLVKNSLKSPENDREYAFAFRILEVFFNDYPEFFQEIESIESVRHCLIKKDFILVDEDSQREIELDSLLTLIFNKEEDVSHVRDFITKGIEQAVGNLKISNSNTNFYFSIDEKAIHNSSFNLSDKTVTFNQLCRYIYKSLNQKRIETFLNFTSLQNSYFRELMIEKGFDIVRSFFIYKIDFEIEFAKNLGIFLGKLTVGQNKPVILDVFDFKAFILKSVEYRRISICVNFVSSFLRQGSFIFVPNNPWLMGILDLLAELHACTLVVVRQVIADLFSYFSLKVTKKSSFMMKDRLIKYVIEYEGILRQVISAALDFSVREICNKIIKSCISVTHKTAKLFFDRICTYASSNSEYMGVSCEKSRKFFLFRNFVINLTKSLIHISSQEPLKASMCGNITHFLKLSMCEMSLDDVYVIVQKNLKICCSIIEKAGITATNEIMFGLFNEFCPEQELPEISQKDLESLAYVIRKNYLPTHQNAENLSFCSNRVPEHDSVPSCDSLKILTESCFVEKTTIRSIESAEYQEIRTFLIQIGRKMPVKKNDYISDEWPSLLSANRNYNFKKMLYFLSTSPDKDEQCLSLCKYLVGHALKVSSEDDFVFGFISKIFNVSYKTKREVVGWLIYSEDSKKYNIPLIRKFIEYDLLCVEEYDQALSKFLKQENPDLNKQNIKAYSEDGTASSPAECKCLEFTLKLLNSLLLEDIKLCTVYDFIYTIEVLNKMNENSRVFEFFKKIEQGMMKFNENSYEACAFDEFIKNNRFTIPPEQYLSIYKEKYKISNLNFRASFKSCWLHFVLYPGSYRFFKIDILASLIREDLFAMLKESLKFLIQAYSKKHYLFFLFYCRFFVKLLDFIEDSIENRTLIWKILEVISPVNFPGFVAQFLEILDHCFAVKFFEKPEFFFFAKELLETLNYNPNLEPLVKDFFVKNQTCFRKYNVYLSFICPLSCASLKNLFNQSRMRPSVIEKSQNSYFTTYFNLTNKYFRSSTNYMDLIDCLNEQGAGLSLAIDGLKSMMDRKLFLREIALTLLTRYNAQNVPVGLKVAAEELFKRSDVKEIILDYENRFFNKM